MRPSLTRFLPDRFILALLGAIAVASVLPVQGIWASAVGLAATAAVMVLFFLHGARLPRTALLAGLTHWRLHLSIFSTTFVVFPLIGLALSLALPSLLPASLWLGILFLCLLPSTVQSSIAFTSIAGGNVSAAVTAAAASNMAGVVVTPLLVGVIARIHSDTAPVTGIGSIVVQLLVPFLLGHLLRPLIGDWVARQKAMLTMTDRGTIVLAVYSAFSAAVLGGVWTRVSGPTLAILVLVCLVILAIILAGTWLASSALGFAREDRITILFCGSKKSLASGVPMARVLFAGPEAGLIILPLMLFHQIQLMACAWIARRMAHTNQSKSAFATDGTDTTLLQET